MYKNYLKNGRKCGKVYLNSAFADLVIFILVKEGRLLLPVSN